MSAPISSTAAAAATAAGGSKELALHLQGHAFTALWIGAGVVAVLVLLVWGAAWYMARQKNSPSDVRLEPLGIPRGSVRSMLGLLIVGGFVDFLLFGGRSFGEANPQLFNTVIAAFGTLTGAVTGFYFGHRATESLRTSGSDQQAQKNAKPSGDNTAG